ncbi:adenosylcobinamide-phosphate synthase CbiB [Anaerosinus sp.]|uniref:adenosylcobinamide-phosphate synthase CbiB n=1 Tax=Selenobaculum sp. TaxID=3074374 RepID=UPI003AB323B6
MIINIAVLAFIFDIFIGDPRSKFHPVVLIGNLISILEKFLLNSSDGKTKKRLSGVLLVISALTIVTSITWSFLHYLYNLNLWIFYLANIILLSFTISPRSLAQAGIEIRNYLLRNDLENARIKVGWIVGRDTKNLDQANITRATVETIAENIVDGIISPLCYYFIGGVVFAVFYRTVNTLDSMIAYKNDKYIDFGMFAAKLDDLFNYIPARLTAIMIIIVAFCLQFDFKQAYRSIGQDAKKHPSPNSGYSEAGVAGALGVQLGGLNYYFGTPSFRAYMGEKKNELLPMHITHTIYIMYGVTILFLVWVAAIGYFWRG